MGHLILMFKALFNMALNVLVVQLAPQNMSKCSPFYLSTALLCVSIETPTKEASLPLLFTYF